MTSNVNKKYQNNCVNVKISLPRINVKKEDDCSKKYDDKYMLILKITVIWNDYVNNVSE